MKKIQLEGKEYPIKIDNSVLEDFEEQSGVPAFEFNQKSMKQFKVMTILALRKGGECKLSDSEISANINMVTMVPLVEEYFLACLGPDGAEKIVEAEDTKKN